MGQRHRWTARSLRTPAAPPAPPPIALALAGDGAAVVDLNTRSSREEAEARRGRDRGEGRARAPGRSRDYSDPRGGGPRPPSMAALARFGRLDILVRIRRRPSPGAAHRDQPRRRVHITGAHRGRRLFLCPGMPAGHVAGGGGTARQHRRGPPHGAHDRSDVITAKAVLVGLTKAIAVEFADRGITANCVVPGKIGGERSRTAGHLGVWAAAPADCFAALGHRGGGGRRGAPPLPAAKPLRHRPDDPREWCMYMP